jgi:hypothetical protein
MAIGVRGLDRRAIVERPALAGHAEIRRMGIGIDGKAWRRPTLQRERDHP